MVRSYLKLDKNKSISLESLWIIFATLFFSYERIFISYLSPLGYADEAFAILTTVEVFVFILSRKRRFTRNEYAVLLLLIIIVVVGVFGNIFVYVQKNVYLIGIDIVSTVKVFLSYYWIRIKHMKTSDWDDVIKGLAKVTRLLVIVMFIMYFVSYVVHTGMLAKGRYGLMEYRFLFNNPGNYSKLFYFIIPLLSADLYYKNNTYKKAVIIIALLLWLTTLRSRAFAFVAVYVIFIFWIFVLRAKKRKTFSRFNILPLAIISILICWNQISFYFTTETQARYQLLKYAIITMQNYMPFGAGFGTYGSDIAVTNYSALYVKYGFTKIYGMGYVHAHFLNDNYWPMIIGQFGLVGLVATVFLIVLFYKNTQKKVSENKYFMVASFLMMIFLVASSLASKSYAEFSMMGIFMLHGILYQRENSK